MGLLGLALGRISFVFVLHEGCSLEPCSKALVRPGDDLFNHLPEFTHWEFISSETTVNTASLSEVQIKRPGKQECFPRVRECVETDLLLQSRAHFVPAHKA